VIHGVRQDKAGSMIQAPPPCVNVAVVGIRHSLGLALVRQHNYADALPELRQASEFAPYNARYAYVYAIALNSIGADYLGTWVGSGHYLSS
jgi:Flp pilus assembly protein TadD